MWNYINMTFHWLLCIILLHYFVGFRHTLLQFNIGKFKNLLWIVIGYGRSKSAASKMSDCAFEDEKRKAFSIIKCNGKCFFVFSQTLSLSNLYQIALYIWRPLQHAIITPRNLFTRMRWVHMPISSFYTLISTVPQDSNHSYGMLVCFN